MFWASFDPSFGNEKNWRFSLKSKITLSSGALIAQLWFQ
jgi:hypothetical protein